jgi:hypothetical protein
MRKIALTIGNRDIDQNNVKKNVVDQTVNNVLKKNIEVIRCEDFPTVKFIDAHEKIKNNTELIISQKDLSKYYCITDGQHRYKGFIYDMGIALTDEHFTDVTDEALRSEDLQKFIDASNASKQWTTLDRLNSLGRIGNKVADEIALLKAGNSDTCVAMLFGFWPTGKFKEAIDKKEWHKFDTKFAKRKLDKLFSLGLYNKAKHYNILYVLRAFKNDAMDSLELEEVKAWELVEKFLDSIPRQEMEKINLINGPGQQNKMKDFFNKHAKNFKEFSFKELKHGK